MIPHFQWRYACPVVFVKCLLAFAGQHVRWLLRIRHQQLNLALASSGLPLYPEGAFSPSLEVRAALIVRSLGSGLVSHMARCLGCCCHSASGKPWELSRIILKRVFGGHLLASILNGGLGSEVVDSLSSIPVALRLQPHAASAYICARGNVTWWDAVRSCDICATAAHIDLGADVASAECGSEWTILHWAAVRGNVPMMELAISCGACIDARDRGGCTPLHLAARNDRVDAASLLVTCGADVDARGDGNCTPLQMAAYRGHCTVMRLLIGCGADLASQCDERRTPLHWAAHEGHCDAIRLLVGCSADVNASAGECGTPLHLATFKGQCPAILLLLEAGADVNALQMTSAHSRDR